MSLSKAWNRRKSGSPCVATLGTARRCARRGAPGAHRPNLGVPGFRHFYVLDKDVSPFRPAGTANLA
eukprot:9650420-Alexandrium_andersonii.AAC.1